MSILRTSLIVVGAIAASATAQAGVTTAESDGVRATLYAPDWVWKGQNLNFLVVVDNESNEAVDANLDLSVANAELDEISVSRAEAARLTIDPGASSRFGFANVATNNAIVDKEYAFVVVAAAPVDSSKTFRIEMPSDVRVIRGAVVSEGIWAAIVPAAVAAAWCVVLALYFRRYAAPAAWKTPSPAIWESN